MSERNNPNYPEWHRFTVAECPKCGEWYEPICRLPHICKKQNSYPRDVGVKVSYEKLWEMIAAIGMSQKDLAEIADISPNTLGRMKKGEHTTTEVLVKICLTLECTPNDILEFG